MKSYLKSLIIAASVGTVAVSAQANAVFFETFNAMPDDPSSTATEVGGQTGDTVTDFFRWDPNNTSNPYITVTPSTTAGIASISWNLNGSGFELEAIYMKGGNLGGNIYTITDDEELIGSGTLNTPTAGASGTFAGISHIDFLVSPGGVTRNVPDGGATVMLLGIALAGLGLIRRKVA